MVVVKIELWPGGAEAHARSLGEIKITKEMGGLITKDLTEGFADYRVACSHAGTFYGKPGAYRTGRVTNHRRALSPYHLVARALAACGIK